MINFFCKNFSNTFCVGGVTKEQIRCPRVFHSFHFSYPPQSCNPLLWRQRSYLWHNAVMRCYYSKQLLKKHSMPKLLRCVQSTMTYDHVVTTRNKYKKKTITTSVGPRTFPSDNWHSSQQWHNTDKACALKAATRGHLLWFPPQCTSLKPATR